MLVIIIFNLRKDMIRFLRHDITFKSKHNEYCKNAKVISFCGKYSGQKMRDNLNIGMGY
jgi:hypothetical protein